MEPSTRPYSGRPAEERIQGRRRRLLDTAFSLLASDGWRNVTIDKLCRRARLNKRYFYESFPDLDELAGAVVDDIAAELMNRGFKAVREAQGAALSTDELARSALAEVVNYVTDDPRRARVLFTEAVGSPRAVAHRRTTILGLARALSEYGHEHHKADGAHPIAEITAALLIGGTMEAILAWLDGGIKMPREQFIDDLAALWVLAGDGAADRARARQAEPPE